MGSVFLSNGFCFPLLWVLCSCIALKRCFCCGCILLTKEHRTHRNISTEPIETSLRYSHNRNISETSLYVSVVAVSCWPFLKEICLCSYIMGLYEKRDFVFTGAQEHFLLWLFVLDLFCQTPVFLCDRAKERDLYYGTLYDKRDLVFEGAQENLSFVPVDSWPFLKESCVSVLWGSYD